MIMQLMRGHNHTKLLFFFVKHSTNSGRNKHNMATVDNKPPINHQHKCVNKTVVIPYFANPIRNAVTRVPICSTENQAPKCFDGILCAVSCFVCGEANNSKLISAHFTEKKICLQRQLDVLRNQQQTNRVLGKQREDEKQHDNAGAHEYL